MSHKWSFSMSFASAQAEESTLCGIRVWVPAYAGMTDNFPLFGQPQGVYLPRRTRMCAGHDAR